MTRCIVVLGAAGTGKSTLVEKFCGLEGGQAPAATPLEIRPAHFTFIGDDWTFYVCRDYVGYYADNAFCSHRGQRQCHRIVA